MFDGGERFWPEEAPFHTPVFVVTHIERAPWERPGGTTFHFVRDGIESALAKPGWPLVVATSGSAEEPTSSSNTSTPGWWMSSLSPSPP
jgi:hypothetical protein